MLLNQRFDLLTFSKTTSTQRQQKPNTVKKGVKNDDMNF